MATRIQVFVQDGVVAGLIPQDRYDATSDITTAIRQDRGVVQAVQALLGRGTVQVVVGGVLVPLANQQTWGDVTCAIEQCLPGEAIWRRVGDQLRAVAVLRRPVWKQLPATGVNNPDRAVPAHWLTVPNEASIKLQKYPNRPVMQGSYKAFQTFNLDNVSEKQWDKTVVVVSAAIDQPHFRYFDRLRIIGLGGHTSNDDPQIHATVQLTNLNYQDQLEVDMRNKDFVDQLKDLFVKEVPGKDPKYVDVGKAARVVTAHIYHDNDNKFTGYRIFMGSLKDVQWEIKEKKKD